LSADPRRAGPPAAAFRTRPARRADAPRLLRLMRGLAQFEGYLESFAVTRRELERRAFGHNAQCAIEIAEDLVSGNILGYAVILTTPYTYDLKPTLTLKELYVEPHARGLGVGKTLMRAVAARAMALSAGRLRWDVLPGNDRAESFYRSLGGRRVDDWIPYFMDEPALHSLAASRPRTIGEQTRRLNRRRLDGKRESDPGSTSSISVSIRARADDRRT
jgi:ribosomal protein S18 acetylase RimI-like enzyme